MSNLRDLEDFFDDNIPDEVLNDPGWEPRLLPTPDNLLQGMGGFDDMMPNLDEDDY